MKLWYYLVDNPMTEDPKDCRAQVTGYEAVTESELFDYITRKGSGITTAEVKGNYTEIIEAHEFFLKQGYGINTEFVKARPTIQGVFKDKNDSFDASRHQIKFRVRLSKRYKEIAANVKTEKVEAIKNVPLLIDFRDISSDTVNETLTPGGVGHLLGSRLKYDETDENQGIYFVATNSTATRVGKIITMKPSEIIFFIPQELAAGEYTLEVHAIPKGNQEIKKGSLEDKLVV
ncbi:MAG: DUF4469 domain-containing protein [Chloroflexia bacterium]|nr:DUF4469 domain-containing protein [Chloroflexia bacterium]